MSPEAGPPGVFVVGAEGGNGALQGKNGGEESSLPGTLAMLHLHRNLEIFMSFTDSKTDFNIPKIRWCLTIGVIRTQRGLVYLVAF